MRKIVLSLAYMVLATSVRADDGKAYQKAVDSVALIGSFNLEWEGSYGTGVVIDGDYILTACHVVPVGKVLIVQMPDRDEKGKIWLTDYLKAVVVARDPKRDLALLKIKEEMPPLKPLRLAANSPSPGSSVFTIGSSPRNNVYWRYSGGNVRQVYQEVGPLSNGQQLNARVIEMTTPIQPGDSGGPIINNAGEVVGINSFTVKEGNQVNKGIDISEIRAFLAEVKAKK